jgi:hypothetical protein
MSDLTTFYYDHYHGMILRSCQSSLAQMNSIGFENVEIFCFKTYHELSMLHLLLWPPILEPINRIGGGRRLTLVCSLSTP